MKQLLNICKDSAQEALSAVTGSKVPGRPAPTP